jgi:hypothetical protein
VQSIRAYTDGNDVITMSFGGPWLDRVLRRRLSSRVAKMGRIVTIAAGNAGDSGAFYATSSPGTGIDVISVGSVDNTVIPVQNAISSDRDAPIPYFSPMPLNFTESLPVFAISKNRSR